MFRAVETRTKQKNTVPKYQTAKNQKKRSEDDEVNGYFFEM